jgi:two-component system cell cycle response regulator DivK
MPDTKTILYVEDNLENRILVRRLLQSEGYRIIEAERASQALDILTREIPDLILVDINMPEMDGYTLAQKIRAILTRHVPIIALTANVMRGVREKTKEAGCDGYMEKPIDIDRFLDQVNEYLSQPLKG